MIEHNSIVYNRLPKQQNKTYGKTAIAQVLLNADFPCSKQELIKSLGDQEIEYQKGYLIKFKDAIRNCFYPEYTFDSSIEVILAVSDYLDGMGLSERQSRIW